MISNSLERRLLQIAVAICSLIPLFAGFYYGFWGMSEAPVSAPLDSHFRYLAGLHLGMGICFVAMVPKIEQHVVSFRMLIFIVFIAGLCRLWGAFYTQTYLELTIVIPLVVELLIAPLLCLWQTKVSQKT